MTQLLPSQAPSSGRARADYVAGVAAAGRQPITMFVDGDKLYGTFYEPASRDARGPRVGVVVAEQFGWHRMHHRLARHLAAAGCSVLTYDFRGRGESEGGDAREMWERHHIPASMVADTRQAMATLRALTPLDKMLGYAYCQAGHVLGQCAIEGGLDGLVFVGATFIDDHFRENYKGVLSGLVDVRQVADDLDMFPALADFGGPLLFIHGDGDLFLQASPIPLLIARLETWSKRGEVRQYELCSIQNADHTFSRQPHESIVIEQTLQWVQRYFGPRYPSAWQGPPPADVPARPARAEGIEVQVPLLATGAILVPVPEGMPGAAPGAWRLELPDGRAFALTDALRRLVSLVDGHRPVGAIAAELSAALAHPVSAEQ